MKWDETASHGKEATLTMEIEWKQIEGCITSDDAEIGIPTCIPLALVVREPLPGERERMSQHTTCTRSTLRFFLNPCQADLRSNINELSIWQLSLCLWGFPADGGISSSGKAVQPIPVDELVCWDCSGNAGRSR